MVFFLIYGFWRRVDVFVDADVSEKHKVKSKAVPVHAMEAFRGRGGIAPTHSRPRH
jgi:hypothetical protein